MKITSKHLGNKFYFFRDKTKRELEIEESLKSKYFFLNTSGIITNDILYYYSCGTLKKIIKASVFCGKKNGKKIIRTSYEYYAIDEKLKKEFFCHEIHRTKNKRYVLHK